MQYDISDIIDPKVFTELSKLDKRTGGILRNIVAIHKEAAQMNIALTKVTGKSLTELDNAAKKATKTGRELERNTTKLIKINTQYNKKLQALAKQKEKETKKTAEQIKKEKDLAIVNSKTAGTLEKLAAKNRLLRNELKKLNLETDKGKKRQKEIVAELDKNTAKIKENQDAYVKQKMGIGGYQEAIERSIPALRGMSAGMRGVGASMKALLANPIILFLTAIVGAIAALRKALTRSEKGQDALNKITQVFGAILEKLADIVTILAEKLIDAFSNPKKAISDLWKAIKQNFINRLLSAKKFFIAMGDLIKGVFELDTDKIKSAAKKAGNAFIDMNTGVIDTAKKASKAMKDEVNAIKEAANKGKIYADMQADYNKVERKYIVQNAKYRMQSASALAEAEKIKRSDAMKSIALYNKAFNIDEKQLRNDIDLAKRKLAMVKMKADIAKNDIETNKQIAEAEAAVFEKEAAFNQKRRQRERMLNMVKMEAVKQEKERLKGLVDAQKAELEQEKLVNKELLDDTRISYAEKLQILDDQKKKELDIIQKGLEADKLELDKRHDLGMISEEAYINQIKALDKKAEADKLKIKQDSDAKKLALTKKTIEDAKALELAGLKEQEAAVIKALREQYIQGKITKEEYERQLTEVSFNASQERLKIALDTLKKEIDALPDGNAEKIKLQRQYNEQKAKLEDDALQHAITNIETEKEKRLQATETWLNNSAQAFSNITNLYKAAIDAQISNLEKQKAYELELAGDNEKKKEEINRKYAKKEAELKRKQAIADKANAIFGIAISTALGIMKASPNVPLMVFVGSMGAIQAATVLAKPIPKFAKGTDNAPGGLSIVGEAGRELVKEDGKIRLIDKPTLTYLKPGAKVIPNLRTEQILRAGKDDFIIRDAIDRQTGSIVEAINNKKELYINTRTGRITEREGNYFKEYMNKKIVW